MIDSSQQRLRSGDLGARSLRAVVLAWFFLLLASGHAIASEEERERAPYILDDFAVGRALHAGEAGGLQSVLLDFEVYERSIESGLADLRVFDAQGRAVPYALRRRLPKKSSRTKSAYRALPLFRLDETEKDRALGSEGEYRIDAELSDSGAIVRVFRGDGSPAEGGSDPSWLLDATALKPSIVGIEFDFEDGSGDFVSRMRLESSNDLARWRSVRADIVVASLSQDGHRIERMRFDLKSTKAKYLRLVPEAGKRLPGLREVRVRPADVRRGARLPKEMKVITGRLDPESPQTVLFDLAGAPSVEFVRVFLPSEGYLVEGRIESSENPDGPWSRRRDELVYYYEREGLPFRNAKIDWSGRRHRYIRFVSSNRGGGLQGQLPGLEIEWVPDQLLYLDRGDGASTLAIGRLGARDASFTPARLLQTLRGRGDDLREATARLGEERVLAGDRALEPPPEPIPWRTYGLWAVLIAIVGILLLLSMRLMRTIDSSSD